MIKNLLKSKKYLFIGTLLTAGVIAGITYNIILSNNSGLQVSDNLSTKEINYNDLQEQIDELRISLENTQNELNTTKEQLNSANNEIADLNIQIASLSDSSKEVNTKVIKVEGTAQNANTNANEAKDTASNTASELKNVYEKVLEQEKLIEKNEDEPIIGIWETTISEASKTYSTIYEFKSNGDFYINSNKVGIYKDGSIIFKDSNDQNFRIATYNYTNGFLYLNLYQGKSDIIVNSDCYESKRIN